MPDLAHCHRFVAQPTRYRALTGPPELQNGHGLRAGCLVLLPATRRDAVRLRAGLGSTGLALFCA